MDRIQETVRHILFREPHPAPHHEVSRYLGPRRFPGTTPIGLRKRRPELFQDTLDSKRQGYAEWLKHALDRCLRLAIADRAAPDRAAPTERERRHILRTARRVLECRTDGGSPLHEHIPQQMYEDVFIRIIGRLLHPEDPRREIHLYRAFNALCHRLGLALLDAIDRRGIGVRASDMSGVIRAAVLSGYVGINLKSSASAASALLNRDLLSIPGAWVRNLDAAGSVSAADLVAMADELLDLAESPRGRFQLTALGEYHREVVDSGDPTLLVFFCDDYLESLIDLKRFEAMLDRNPRLRVLFVPRAGRYGNDLAYADMAGILREPSFRAVVRHIGKGRLHITPHGPRAGCIDPRDVSFFLIHEIDRLGENRRIIFETKGCRNFEMLQGRLSVPWYAAFNCNRALSIRTVEVDGWPVFLRIPPGLPAYDGFTEPRIGRSPSFGTSGVRFARMTTRNLYAALKTGVYRRFLSEAGDERILHAVLSRWCDAAGATFSELIETLAAGPSPHQDRFETLESTIPQDGPYRAMLTEPFRTRNRRNFHGKA